MAFCPRAALDRKACSPAQAFGEVAEWFKAAVLKTSGMSNDKHADNLTHFALQNGPRSHNEVTRAKVAQGEVAEWFKAGGLENLSWAQVHSSGVRSDSLRQPPCPTLALNESHRRPRLHEPRTVTTRSSRATLAAMPPRRHTNYAHRLARVIVLNDGTVIVTLLDAVRIVRERCQGVELAIEQLRRRRNPATAPKSRKRPRRSSVCCARGGCSDRRTGAVATLAACQLLWPTIIRDQIATSARPIGATRPNQSPMGRAA